MAQHGTPAKATTGTPVTVKPFDRYIKALAGEAELTANEFDAGDITRVITEKMIGAESLEEAIEYQDSGLPSGQDIKDVEHEVITFEVVKSTKKDAPLGHYLRVEATALEESPSNKLGIGEMFTYTVGAANIVNLLLVARRTDRLPLECVIRGKSVGDGDNELLLLRLLPKRAHKL
jgi:hypothetical protein